MSVSRQAVVLVAWVIASSPVSSAGCRGADDAAAESPQASPVPPYGARGANPAYDYRSHPVEYSGPGRDEPAPQDVSEVRLGWFGPSKEPDTAGVMMFHGARLAIEEANAAGGYRGAPFRMIPVWSENPWGSGVRQVTQLVYRDRVWALLGAPDSASAHLVEQVVAKARLAFVSPVTTDDSTNLVNVPWMFSLAPGDRVIAEAWARALRSDPRIRSTVLVSGTDHESRRLSSVLLEALKATEIFPRLHLTVRPGEPDLSGTLRLAVHASADGAIVIASAPETSRIIATLRAAGVSSPIFAGPRAREAIFTLRTHEKPAELTEVLAPLLWEAASHEPISQTFVHRFRERYEAEPDYTAAYAYDAVRLVIQAIRTAGLNRARVADAIRALDGFPGVSGPIQWDPTGRRRADARDIRIVQVPPPGPRPPRDPSP